MTHFPTVEVTAPLKLVYYQLLTNLTMDDYSYTIDDEHPLIISVEELEFLPSLFESCETISLCPSNERIEHAGWLDRCEHQRVLDGSLTPIPADFGSFSSQEKMFTI